MQKQPQVSVRNAEVPPPVQARCFDEIDKLERYYNRITSCNVVIVAPHQQHKNGNLWEVRIDMMVPGQKIVVNRVSEQHAKGEDIDVVIGEAFKKARRQLEDYVRRTRG